MKFDTREAWINAAATLLIDEVIAPVISIEKPLIRYSLTAPKNSQKSTQILGECWNKSASQDDHFEIFITANLGNTDSILILATLLHEQLHAYDGNKNGHKQPFIDLCKLVKLEGGQTSTAKNSFTATIPSQELTETLKDLVNYIGEIPHGALNPSKSGKKKQTNRQRLVYCTNQYCGFKFRSSQKMIDSMTTDKCLCCQQNSLIQE